ncbi:hypothetical protein [Sphingorhabdus sp.]|uniref:hypothetical protein n=1 Tax=Sphingorhabdus sp. TaxID=1902408 RepID=UPI003782F0F0
MDNTLKILLGVLSVTGFITVLIPQGNPIATHEAADGTNAEVNAPPPEPTAPPPSPPPSPPPVPFDSGVSVGFITGAPSIDGRPIQADFGLPFGVSPRSERENPDAPRKNKIGYTPPLFAVPGATALDEREGEMATKAPFGREPTSQDLLGSPATINR